MTLAGGGVALEAPQGVALADVALVVVVAG
jgi:hypothetical protein